MAPDAAWFGGRLRELREAAGLTQQQLAERVGCKWLAVSRWERGEREPGWGQVNALCEALGVSCEEFRKLPAEREPAGPGRPRKDGPVESTPPAEDAPANRSGRPKPRKKEGKGD